MENNIATDFLQTIIMWVAPIGMIVLVVFLVKDIKGIITGQTNIGSVVIKVLCIFLIIGIMFAAGSFDKFGNIFKGVVDSVVTEENLPQIGDR